MGWIPTAAAACSNMKKILIGIPVIAALLGARALAADLEARAPPPVPFSNWSGPYIGIGAGARYNAVDGNVTVSDRRNTTRHHSSSDRVLGVRQPAGIVGLGTGRHAVYR